ncbi:Lipoyl ligase [Aphanomyces cochlioides]|nr:Lipoyl ligase [Aphanomyces cochlioides]
MSRVTRVNGFQRPFSRDQLTSLVLQPVLISAFLALTISYLHELWALWILIPYAVLIIITGTCWVLCEWRNPASPQATSTWCLRVPSKPTRYCSVCNKNSPGLDHHCTWLNTCIGGSNYEPFFILISTGTIMAAYQAMIGIVMATLWHKDMTSSWHPEANIPGSLAALWLHNIVSMLLALAYGSLTSFHIYLLYLGMGTYDFILKYGANNMCIRLLRCQCFRRSKSKEPKSPPTDKDKPGEKRASKSKIGASSVLEMIAPSSSGHPSASEVAAWKKEWLDKYPDDSHHESEKEHEVARARKVSASNIHVELDQRNIGSASSVAPLAVSPPPDDSTPDTDH